CFTFDGRKTPSRVGLVEHALEADDEIDDNLGCAELPFVETIGERGIARATRSLNNLRDRWLTFNVQVGREREVRYQRKAAVESCGGFELETAERFIAQ